MPNNYISACGGSINFDEFLKSVGISSADYNKVWLASYSSQPLETKLKPERIIFQNNYATIVYWNDGTKTIVKKSENDEFIPEVGFAMALVKRIYGNRSEVLRWIESAEVKE